MTLTSKDKQNINTNERSGDEWSVEDEIQLFNALTDLKPIGINRHFYMAIIAERLSRALNRDIPSEHVWAHLKTLYNLDLLNEMEPLPFPNEEQEFFLPEDEYATLMAKKRASSDDVRQNTIADDGPPSIIAVVTDNTSRTSNKELERKITQATTTGTAMPTKSLDATKRAQKRTRGSMSMEPSSPSTTPPPIQASKRRRI